MPKWCMTTPLKCTIIIVHVRGRDAGRNTDALLGLSGECVIGDLDVTSEKNSLEIA